MKRSKILKALAVTAALPLLYLADTAPDASTGLTLIRDAQAIVGAPATPVSVAGVARRTTRRVVVAQRSAVAATTATTSARAQQKAATAQQQQATAQQQAATAQQQAATAQQQAAAARPAGAPPVGTVVNALPGGCKPETKNGVEVQNCGGVYYRAAFQGNNLVYVVQ
jgi:biotin carboxyl carrier protein